VAIATKDDTGIPEDIPEDSLYILHLSPSLPSIRRSTHAHGSHLHIATPTVNVYYSTHGILLSPDVSAGLGLCYLSVSAV
jgi:hypothetical protein